MALADSPHNEGLASLKTQRRQGLLINRRQRLKLNLNRRCNNEQLRTETCPQPQRFQRSH